MVTFIGEPNLLVRLNPPIGNIKHVRFDVKGEFNTENELMIQRFHHRFDSCPSNNTATEGMTDDLEYQDHGKMEIKQYTCKNCDFTTIKKGDLMVHYRQNHPKEEV